MWANSNKIVGCPHVYPECKVWERLWISSFLAIIWNDMLCYTDYIDIDLYIVFDPPPTTEPPSFTTTQSPGDTTITSDVTTNNDSVM